MKKIFKIIIKKDPIFKYIVEDYPFYEGIFFHSKDFHTMNILSSHYLLRQHLSINQGNVNFIYKPKYLLRLNSNIDIPSPGLIAKSKFKLKSKAKNYTFNVSKAYIHFNLRVQSQDKTCVKITINPHLIKLIRLKTHDPYALENRDMLKLSNMDGEKFL